MSLQYPGLIRVAKSNVDRARLFEDRRNGPLSLTALSLSFRGSTFCFEDVSDFEVLLEDEFNCTFPIAIAAV